MASSTDSDNRRLVKNTGMLYIRMILIMLITLYTSRVVLQQLGANDYGIYNVVGGMVAMFAIITQSLSSAISRFIAYEIGQGAKGKVKEVFSTAVTVQIMLGVVVFILIEVLGLWFLGHKMNIAPERMSAARWVLQCSAVTFFVGMINVPYNAMLIAYEKMKAFAYVGIIEVVLKLGIALMLYLSLFDSLKFYALMIAVVSFAIRAIYRVYCRRAFSECRFTFHIRKDILKGMLSFSSWNFIGSSSAILRDQGVNVLLNLFFGTAVNAARGIANQVNTAITGFVLNFTTALNPQIIKSYSAGNRDRLMTLVIQGARLSFCLLFFLSMPIIIEADTILHIWLVKVPDYSVAFVQLVLVFALSECISYTMLTANQATGKIRNYQLVVGGLQTLNFPGAYLLLRWGLSPVSPFVLAIVISQICFFARLVMLNRRLDLPVGLFMRRVYLKSLMIALICIPVPLAMHLLMPQGWLRLVAVLLLSWALTGVVIYFIGLNREERDKVKNLVSKFLKRDKVCPS